MPIVLGCESCGKTFGVADEHAGKLIRCPGCKEAVRVGASADSGPQTPSSGKSAQKRQEPSQKPRQRPRRREVPEPESEELARYAAAPIARRPSKRARIEQAKKNKRSLQLAACALFAVLVPVATTFVAMKLYAIATESHQEIAESNSEADKPAGRATTPDATQSASDSAISRSSGGAIARPTNALRENRIDGDRVAWLDASGNGYARVARGWIYNGAANHAPFHSGSGSLRFPLIETMRNDSLVELFDPSSSTRVRLNANKAVAYTKAAHGEFTQSNGGWKNSTTEAAWLAEISENDMLNSGSIEISASDRLQDFIAAVEPNVVRIDATKEDGSSNGSGFLIDASGRVVTNYHVIEGCTSATVLFKGDGANNSIRLEVAGFLHLDSERDVAVLHVELPSDFRRPGLRIAPQKPAKGSSVVAFGAPLGLDFTASEGIISGFRSAQELERVIGLSDHEGNWIQTTAPISPGNSGGPLVDRQGHVGKTDPRNETPKAFFRHPCKKCQSVFRRSSQRAGRGEV